MPATYTGGSSPSRTGTSLAVMTIEPPRSVAPLTTRPGFTAETVTFSLWPLRSTVTFLSIFRVLLKLKSVLSTTTSPLEAALIAETRLS